jgi:hypothetical protein
MRIKRGLVLATATAALGVSLLAGSAQATTGNGTADCAVGGTIRTTPPLRLMGGYGTYQFNSFTADCSFSDATDGTVMADLAIDSQGTYSNNICGTGSLNDTDASMALTASDPAGKLGGEFPINSIGYSVNYADFDGALDITSSGTNSDGHSLDTTRSTATLQFWPDPDRLNDSIHRFNGECIDTLHVVGTLHLEY